VLPFVFARADRPFLRNGLPLLAGMAITFAGVATLAADRAAAGPSAANSAAAGLRSSCSAHCALLLIFPQPADRAMRRWSAWRPIVGARHERSHRRLAAAGVATGLAGRPAPARILGIILTGAALQGPCATDCGCLLAYALGAATSLAWRCWSAASCSPR
jgi:cytochrome c biogenesis protein CcdA